MFQGKNYLNLFGLILMIGVIVFPHMVSVSTCTAVDQFVIFIFCSTGLWK